MDRRGFLTQSLGLGAAAWLGLRPGQARAAGDSGEGGWRLFEVVTAVEVQKPEGPSRLWLPLPLSADTDYHKSLGSEWRAAGGSARLAADDRYGVSLLAAEWPAGAPPVLELKSRFATRDRAVDLGARPGGARLEAAARRLYTAPTRLIPTDGIVASTARDIVKRVGGGDVDKARALYDWICDNTFRDPKVRGCGVGDIKAMLESRSLGGKCADLNALFVGLARSLGIPARDVYGVRVADSRRGYKALGRSGDISKAQHCRAEFFAEGRGWIPVDPADVRKVVLEEPPGNLAANDARVAEARRFLFGAWEMNWLAYNHGHDVVLPGASAGPLPFLMYPQGETGGGRLDSLDPAAFRYSITSRELT